jgi:hypothetical protein
MTQQIREVVPTRIDWCVSAMIGNTMPPRDPDEDDEDEDEDDEDEDEDDEDDGREPNRRTAGRARAGQRLGRIR